MLDSPEVAVFDLVTHSEIPPEGVGAYPVAFRVWIHKSAFNLGRWAKVDKSPIRPELAQLVPRFSQDRIRPTEFFIWIGPDCRPATFTECENLECAAVWDPEHVEDRVRDHISGVSNKWVQSMQPRPAA